jgi:Glycosyltransferase family 87
MTSATTRRLLRLPTWLVRACLVLSLAYLAVAGVIASWSPALNGLDLSVCYVAGATATRGASPYRHHELVETRRALHPSVAAKTSLPFGYPPAAVPACILLSRLPWEVANAVWKVLNLAFVIGCVVLTIRLIPDLHLAPDARYLAWSIAAAFSPTVSVLLVGQSTLFVLCTALLGVVLSERQRPAAAGACLALSLIKPHLIFPLVAFLLVRRKYGVLLIAGAITALLTVVGLYLGHESLGGFLEALGVYTSWNSPTNPRLVGIQNLASNVFGWPRFAAQAAGLTLGLLFLALALILERARSRRGGENALPAILVVSVLSFGAHSYDLVFLIPVCVWAIGRVQTDRRFLPIVLLCALLVVPLGAVTLVSRLLPPGSVGDSLFRVAIEPYRSWILLILMTLVMYVTARPVLASQSAEPAPVV